MASIGDDACGGETLLNFSEAAAFLLKTIFFAAITLRLTFLGALI